jgi:hypothetical protein
MPIRLISTASLGMPLRSRARFAAQQGGRRFRQRACRKGRRVAIRTLACAVTLRSDPDIRVATPSWVVTIGRQTSTDIRTVLESSSVETSMACGSGLREA